VPTCVTRQKLLAMAPVRERADAPDAVLFTADSARPEVISEFTIAELLPRAFLAAP